MSDRGGDNAFKAMEEEMSRFEQEIADVTANLPQPPPLDDDEQLPKLTRGGPSFFPRPRGPPMRPAFIPHQLMHRPARLPPPPPPPGNLPFEPRGPGGPAMGQGLMGPGPPPPPSGGLPMMRPAGPPPPPGQVRGVMMGPEMPIGPGPGPIGPFPMGFNPAGPRPMLPIPMVQGPIMPGPVGPSPLGPGPIGPIIPGMAPVNTPQPTTPTVIAKPPTTYSAKPVKFKTKKDEKMKKKKGDGQEKAKESKKTNKKDEAVNEDTPPEVTAPEKQVPEIPEPVQAVPQPMPYHNSQVPTEPIMQQQFNYAQFQTPVTSEEPKEPPQKKQKKKKILRTAAGTVWEDDSLTEWEANDFRMFCGDLGNEITDETLAKVFGRYNSFLKAKVVRDKRSNKSKGYGFVSFKDPGDFAQAMRDWNGKYVGNRPIKLRKSTWKERNLDIAKKKQKEKERLGLR